MKFNIGYRGIARIEANGVLFYLTGRTKEVIGQDGRKHIHFQGWRHWISDPMGNGFFNEKTNQSEVFMRPQPMEYLWAELIDVLKTYDSEQDEVLNTEDFQQTQIGRTIVRVLTNLADKLDEKGLLKEAEQIDNITRPLPMRPLGQLNYSIGCIGLGGESIISMDEHRDEGIALIRRALELGINYFDTAPTYGSSEIRLGEALDERESEKVFIATKTEDRTRDGSLKVLENSLKRLRRNWIDLWQIHHLESMADVNKAFSKGGCFEALLQAKEQGLVKHLGITGHYDPEPIVEAIKRFDFDTVLIATNASDVHHRSFIKDVLPIAQKKNMGIIGMKACSRGRLFEPVHLRTMKEALSYVLTLPISTVIIGHDDIRQLEENVQIAKEFEPLTDQERKELEDKTKDYVELSQFYKKDFEKFNPFW